MRGATRVYGNEIDRQAVVGHHIITRREATNKANFQNPVEAELVLDPDPDLVCHLAAGSSCHLERRQLHYLLLTLKMT